MYEYKINFLTTRYIILQKIKTIKSIIHTYTVYMHLLNNLIKNLYPVNIYMFL